MCTHFRTAPRERGGRSSTRALRSLQRAVTEKQEQIRRCREEGAAVDVQQQLVRELVRMKMRQAHAEAKLTPPAPPDALTAKKRLLVVANGYLPTLAAHNFQHSHMCVAATVT